MSVDSYKDKYELYCKASCGEQYGALPESFRKIHRIIENELPEILENAAPNKILEVCASFERYLQLLKYYCHFPTLFSKKVVAVGGRFSSGKSSFINRLLGGEKQLSADINPTTSVPTYLVKGSTNTIYAQNFLERVVMLTEEEFESLVHDQDNEFGSSISRLFTSVYIEKESFRWNSIAILDTPGYSKPDNEDETVTDKNIAKQQLNSADYILWLISSEDGTITEDDLLFLTELWPHIPKLILLNKADKKSPEDIVDIIALVKETLQKRNIQFVDVLPVSSRRKSDYSPEVVSEVLNELEKQITLHPLALEFKKNWLAFNQFYQAQITKFQEDLAEFNKLSFFSESAEMNECLEYLKGRYLQLQKNYETLQNKLRELQTLFFQQLNTLGEDLGISLREPTDLEVMRLNPSHSFITHLEMACKNLGVRVKNYDAYFTQFNQPVELKNLSAFLRQDSERFVPVLESMQLQEDGDVLGNLLRKVTAQSTKNIYQKLNT